jgi:hypothetical protein
MLVKTIALKIPSLDSKTLSIELLDANGLALWTKAGITQSQTIIYNIPDTSNTGIPIVGMNALRFTLSAALGADVEITALVYGV